MIDGEAIQLRHDAAEAQHRGIAAVYQDLALVEVLTSPRERGDTTAEWDELIVARMALTVATVHGRQRATAAAVPLGLSDPAVLQTLLRPDADEAEISRAVYLLGFAPGQSINVVALTAKSNIEWR